MYFDPGVIPRNICRACLSEDPAIEITSEVSDKLKICGGISGEEIEDKTFPSKICHKCFMNLEISFEFRQLCQQSNKTLKGSLHNALLNFDENEDLLKNLKVEFLVPKEEPNENSENGENEGFMPDIQLNEKAELKFDDKEQNSVKDFDVKNTHKLDLGLNLKIKKKQKYTKYFIDKLEKHDLGNAHHLCKFCGKNYVSKFSMENHMRLHSARLRFVCEICDDSYAGKFQLEQHMCSKHTGERNFKCEYCDKAFFSKILKNKHQRRSHSKRFKCDQCDKSFGRPDLLKKHMRVHTGEKPIVCDKCGTRFKELHHLKTHNKSMTTCILKMSINVNGE